MYHQVKRMFAACGIKVLELKEPKWAPSVLIPHLPKGSADLLKTTN
jgi:16S rRNA U516 pseudouridylate synthase RsuA-like enzyme